MGVDINEAMLSRARGRKPTAYDHVAVLSRTYPYYIGLCPSTVLAHPMEATTSRGVETERKLADARAKLERERRRTTDEVDALQRFEDSIRSLDTETPRQQTARPALAAAIDTNGGQSDALGRVRAAYESTVMAVPHYEEEYGDSYRASLAGEFDTHVAVVLTEGATFDERCKTILNSAITDSTTARRSLLAAIDEEADSLSTATETLMSVAKSLGSLSELPFAEESFGCLDAYRARIGQLETKCEDALNCRQRSVFDQRRAAWIPADAPDIAKYLYQDLDTDYPVMSVIADLLERTRALRSRVERAMTFCHA